MLEAPSDGRSALSLHGLTYVADPLSRASGARSHSPSDQEPRARRSAPSERIVDREAFDSLAAIDSAVFEALRRNQAERRYLGVVGYFTGSTYTYSGQGPAGHGVVVLPY